MHAPPALSLRPRQRAAVALGGAVLLLHVGLLAGWPAAPGPPRRQAALQVRQIVLQPAAMPAPAAALPRPAAVPPRRRPAASLRPSNPPPARPTAAKAPAAAEPPAPAAQAESAPADGITVPVYATRLPPPLALTYQMRRGGHFGEAELTWQTDDVAYHLSLRSQLHGAPALGWASDGTIDSHGLAPERHVESRRGRDQRAVNFQRASGVISFSGPQWQLPLLPGAQDRLSWMLQLPAVLAADPALARPGTTVSIFVAGARGDADVWRFEVIGSEKVELPAGPLGGALHLRREPQRPYDALVDVWLDPARHHLPVRTWLRPWPSGEGTELLLQQIRPLAPGG